MCKNMVSFACLKFTAPQHINSLIFNIFKLNIRQAKTGHSNKAQVTCAKPDPSLQSAHDYVVIFVKQKSEKSHRIWL